MTEYHAPESAVGARFEDEISALARRYYEDEGRPEGRSLDHWLRAENELRRQSSSKPLRETEADHQTEEGMQLGQ